MHPNLREGSRKEKEESWESSAVMRVVLPAFLIHAILALSVQGQPDRCEVGSDASPTPEVIPTPLTLWDLGFSLKERWADLREQGECPAPPDLICIDGGAECGDQQVLDDVASSLHPTDTGTVQAQAAPTSVDKVEPEEDLVSFEDWKRRKQEEEDAEDDSVTIDAASSNIGSESSAETIAATTSPGHSAGASDTARHDTQNDSDPSPKPKTDTPNPLPKPPNEAVESVKVHAHSKYNYASPDCSARIHSSSPSTQHASSLLHKSRDRYMLTPCKADQHWVVVELCDEIRIEAIEIAVWEFFSGVVRDVRVSVGGAEDDEEEDGDGGDGDVGQPDLPKEIRNKWEEVGSFVGKNVRGVQVRRTS